MTHRVDEARFKEKLLKHKPVPRGGVMRLVLVTALALGGCASSKADLAVAPIEPDVVIWADKCRGGCPEPGTIDPAQLPPLPKFK